jgi:hypothetical protein
MAAASWLGPNVPAVIWVFAVVGLVLVFAIAAGVVGSVSFRLGHEPQAAIFDVEEAVQTIADELPEQAQARLTHGEVRTLILTTLDHLRDKGVSALPGEELAELNPDDDVVVDDDIVLADVLGAVEAQGLDVTDEDAALVIHGLLGHLADIGALGPRA